MAWVRQLRFPQIAQEFTRLNHLHEVEHMGERVKRLEQAIAEAVKAATPELQEVIKGLQALRGVAQISAVTIAAELGNISRFNTPRQLMGYSGAVPSEDSSGQRTRRGSITKTATRTCDESPSKQPGVIGSGQASGRRCTSGSKAWRKRSRRSPGRRSTDCISVT